MFITVCHLTLHDYLFYASREMGRLYETEKYLHNYGLTYALGLAKSPYTNLTQVPHYSEDLDGMNKQGVYVTPAHPLRYTFSFSTFKPSSTTLGQSSALKGTPLLAIICFAMRTEPVSRPMSGARAFFSGWLLKYGK